MKKNISLAVGLLIVALASSLLMGCNGDAKKLADKEKELEELRQLAELDKREMENQYAEFASQYGVPRTPTSRTRTRSSMSGWPLRPS